MNPLFRRFFLLASIFLGLFVTFRYLLPLIFPFLIGFLLALAAEPIVRFGCRRLRLPRALSAGIGVSLSFLFLVAVLLLLGALLLRQLRELAGILPDLSGTIRGGMDSVSAWMLQLAQKAPDGIEPVLTQNITELFSGGSALLDRVSAYLLRLASGILSQVPGRALSFGTAIIASFMISAKLPKIKSYLKGRLNIQKLQPAADALQHLKYSLICWLKAQFKLSAITFCLMIAGFWLLRIPHGLLWAALIAVVDAFPVLGSGSVLVPWSLVAFLQGDRLLAFGLLGLYGAVAVGRSVLEPRLVGKQLGMDPLVTLLALYVGFRLFGLPGMILSPMIAVTVTQLMELKTNK